MTQFLSPNYYHGERTQNTKCVLTSLWRGFSVILLINIIDALWFGLRADDIYHFALRNGRLILNHESTGLAFSSSRAILIFSVIFLLSMYNFFRKGKLSLQKN